MDNLMRVAAKRIIHNYGSLWLNYAENIAMLGTSLGRANSYTDMFIALFNFYKSFNNVSAIEIFSKKFAEIFEVDFDNLHAQGFRDVIGSLRDSLDNFKLTTTSQMAIKLNKIFLYILSSKLGDECGYTYSEQGYTQIEEMSLRRKHATSGFSFYYFMLDTTVFFLEKGIQVFDSGSIMSLIHDEDTYADFYTTYARLTREANFLSNPTAGDIDISKWLSDVDELSLTSAIIIRRLKAIKNMNGIASVTRLIADLEGKKSTYILKVVAKQKRKVPFALCLYGLPGVGKSVVTQKLITLYAKIFGKSTDEKYVYVRSANEKHWNGYTSDQWVLILDDIASLHPGICKAGDPSVIDLIRLINTIPFMPEQADLADKGMCPFIAELIIATSNTMHMHCDHYFTTPEAVRRRFPFTIEVTVKERFRLNGSNKIDPAKVEIDGTGEDPNLYTVYVIKSRSNGEGVVTSIVKDRIDGNEFYPWMAEQMLDFNHKNAVLNESMTASKKICEHYKFNCAECAVSEIVVDTVDNMLVAQSASTLITVPYTIFRSSIIQFCIDLFLHCLALFSDLLRRDISVRNAIILLTQYFSYEFFQSMQIRNRLRIMQDIIMTEADQLRYFRNLGREVKESFYKNKYLTECIIALITASVASYGIYRHLQIKDVELKHEQEINMLIAGTEIGQVPVPHSVEKVNKYVYRDSSVYSLPQSIAPKLQDTYEQALKSISRCIFYIQVLSSDGKTMQTACAVSVGNCDFITVSHIFKADPQPAYVIKLKISPNGEGITNNVDTLLLDASNMVYHSVYDLLMFRVIDKPDRAYIKDMFNEECQMGFENPGNMIFRSMEGKIKIYDLTLVRISVSEEYRDGETKYQTGIAPEYHGPEPMVRGLCGSVVTVRSKTTGVTIAGIHVAGDGKRGRAIPITQKIITDMKAAMPVPTPLIGGEVHVSNNTITKELEKTIHKKSPLRHVDGCAEPYGQILGHRANASSLVRTTMIAMPVWDVMGLKSDCGPPHLGISAKTLALEAMVTPKILQPGILMFAARSYLTDVLTELMSCGDDSAFNGLCPLDINTTVNGAMGVSYIDKMNFSTSMGFPFNCSKERYLEASPSPTAPDGKMFTKQVLDEMEDLRKTYLKGRRGHIIFRASLKDEPVSAKKRKSGKTRVFTGAPIAYSLLMRQYFLPLVRLIQNNREAFEMAVGTNAMSSEWEDLRKFLIPHKALIKRIIAGDYAEYDKSMSALMILTCFEILIKIAEIFCTENGTRVNSQGDLEKCYKPDDLIVMRGLATDTAHPLIDFFGDLVQFFGGNPSGHPLTVIINCIANSLYIRYAFHLASIGSAYTLADFRRLVHLWTYGDDNIMSVEPEVDFFNHTVIQKTLGIYGIKYTMPDKESESVPFINLADADFLKRRFVYDDELEYLMCPLDEKSIAKMLCIHTASKSVPKEIQTVDIIFAANREYWFHGREVFEERHLQLERVIDISGLRPYFITRPLESFDTIMNTIDHFKDKEQSELEAQSGVMDLRPPEYYCTFEYKFNGWLYLLTMIPPIIAHVRCMKQALEQVILHTERHPRVMRRHIYGDDTITEVEEVNCFGFSGIKAILYEVMISALFGITFISPLIVIFLIVINRVFFDCYVYGPFSSVFFRPPTDLDQPINLDFLTEVGSVEY